MRQCLLDEILHYISPYSITLLKGEEASLWSNEKRGNAYLLKANWLILTLSIYHTKDINSLQNPEGSCGASPRFSSIWEVKGARVNGLMTSTMQNKAVLKMLCFPRLSIAFRGTGTTLQRFQLLSPPPAFPYCSAQTPCGTW